MFTCCTDGSENTTTSQLQLGFSKICTNFSGVLERDFKDKWAEELKGDLQALKVAGTFEDILELSNAGVIRGLKRNPGTEAQAYEPECANTEVCFHQGYPAASVACHS